MKIWNKSFEDLKTHHFSSAAYVAFIIATVIALGGQFKTRSQLYSYLDRFTLVMGFVVAGLVIILYIILNKMTKGELLRPFSSFEERVSAKEIGQ